MLDYIYRGDLVPLFSWKQKYNYKRGLELKESKKIIGRIPMILSVLERIRTSDPSLRRRVLYPAELRGHIINCYYNILT